MRNALQICCLFLTIAAAVAGFAESPLDAVARAEQEVVFLELPENLGDGLQTVTTEAFVEGALVLSETVELLSTPSGAVLGLELFAL